MQLKNHLLIAMPNLQDPNFSRSVTLICEHDSQGAIGVTINRPTPIKLGELLGQLGIQCSLKQVNEKTIMSGGPVSPENGFVLHRPIGDWQSSLAVNKDIGLTSSLDVLKALAHDTAPTDSIIALGYAGWAAGQLEHEMQSNAWLTHPADSDMLFSTPHDKLWNAAASAIGIDISMLSSETGHA